MSPYTSSYNENTNIQQNKNIEINNIKYQLKSVIIHDGNPNYGHYYCFIRPNINNEPDIWYKFNDNIVTKTDFNEVCNIGYGNDLTQSNNNNSFRLFRNNKASCNAYILQYCQSVVDDNI